MKCKNTKRDARFRAGPKSALAWGKVVTLAAVCVSTIWYATDPNKWPVFILTVLLMLTILCMLSALGDVKRDADNIWRLIWEDKAGHEHHCYVWSHQAVDVAKSMILSMPHVDIIVAMDSENRIAAQWERASLG